MRRSVYKFLAVLVLGFFFIGILAAGPLMAAQMSDSGIPDGIPDSQKALVYDGAGILSSSEIERLTSLLMEVNANHDVKLAIATTENTGKRTDEAFADDYYDYNGYSEDGALLLINMNPKGWYISTKGKGIRSFSDYGIQRIGERIRPILSSGNYYAAFEEFISTADHFLVQAESGMPYDTRNPYVEKAGQTEIIVAMVSLALAIALIIVRVLASMMNTVRKQSGAANYAKGLELTGQSDIHLYSHTTSRHIESDSGSSTHSSSSGSSHGGGGGRF